YAVNPPLVRLVAALPVLLDGPPPDGAEPQAHPVYRQEFASGYRLLEQVGPRAFWYLTWARWACIPFSLVGGYFCFRWARELYGDRAGLLSLALWCFCPNILAHAQLITPDAGAAALALVATYAYWRWLRAPSAGGLYLAGVALGLALLTKATLFIF